MKQTVLAVNLVKRLVLDYPTVSAEKKPTQVGIFSLSKVFILFVRSRSLRVLEGFRIGSGCFENRSSPFLLMKNHGLTNFGLAC